MRGASLRRIILRMRLLLLIAAAGLLQSAKVEFVSELASAHKKAAAEWRPVLAVFYGDAAGKESPSESRKNVASWFEKEELKKAIPPCYVVLLSIASQKELAKDLGISSGPYAVFYDPAAKIVAKTNSRDAAGLANWLPVCTKDYVPTEPKWRNGLAATVQSVKNESSRNIVLAACLAPDPAAKLGDQLMQRRLVVPLRRTYVVRMDPEKDAEAAAAAGLKAGQFAVYRPGPDAGDPPRAMSKPAEWTGDARKLQELLNGILKQVDEGK